MGRMLRVFVCSPLRGDIVKNQELCRKLCHEVIKQGHAPWAPHLFYTQFLNDGDATERNTGIAAGISWLGQADQVWVFAETFEECSSGMRMEIERALKFSIPPDVIYMPDCWQKYPRPQPRLEDPCTCLVATPALGPSHDRTCARYLAPPRPPPEAEI